MDKVVYILLATYNGEKYIREQLESLLVQTYQNWILWIHDDGSEDGTVNIIKEYKSKFPNKIKFLDDGLKCGGPKQNFAHLLNCIDDNYDYIMFCDQDDVWLNDKIEITLNKMIEIEKNYPNKPIIIHTDLKVVDEQLNSIADSFFVYQRINPKWSKDFNISLVQNSVTGCTMMINKKAKEISLPIGNNAIMHDWWILLKVLQNDGIVEYVDKATVLYRQHFSNHIGAKGFSFLKLFSKFSSISKYQKMSAELGEKRTKLYLAFKKIFLTINRL